MARVVKGFYISTCEPTCLSTDGMNLAFALTVVQHTALLSKNALQRHLLASTQLSIHFKSLVLFILLLYY